jgi:hypothetical protein
MFTPDVACSLGQVIKDLNEHIHEIIDDMARHDPEDEQWIYLDRLLDRQTKTKHQLLSLVATLLDSDPQ